jgi:hypothetical protein
VAEGHSKSVTDSTGMMVLVLRNCRERVTILGFRCGSDGGAAGEVDLGTLEAQMTTAGDALRLKLLGLRSTFACAGSLRVQLEGYFLGHIGRRLCNVRASELPLEGVLFAHGKFGSEPFYDVYVGSGRHSYKIPAPWRLHFHHKATFSC